MRNLVLEIKRTNDGPIKPEKPVAFNVPIFVSPSVLHNETNGEITFKEPGQYFIHWWVATETTLKGTIGFHLQSLQGSFIPGCSPIKTGQVNGFGTFTVETENTIVSLVNSSMDNTAMISTKCGTKAYLLVTSNDPSSPRVYRGDLSASGSSIQVPLGNGLYYQLENRNSTSVRLFFTPMNGTTIYDLRRFSAYDGAVTTQGGYADNATLSGRTEIDGEIYNNSREMHWVLVRVQNPTSMRWSTYEVRFFVSGGLSRSTVWVNVIEEEVLYTNP